MSIRRRMLVLSMDEKSQIRALDRTQPGLPMKQGRAGRMTHDYKRLGTTTPFAALDVLEGDSHFSPTSSEVARSPAQYSIMQNQSGRANNVMASTDAQVARATRLRKTRLWRAG